jgi:hypothetical protein
LLDKIEETRQLDTHEFQLRIKFKEKAYELVIM